jgi:hypothetical protein
VTERVVVDRTAVCEQDGASVREERSERRSDHSWSHNGGSVAPAEVVAHLDALGQQLEHLARTARWERFVGEETLAALSAAARARRLVDALWAGAARRAEEIAVHTRTQDRDAVALVTRLVGVPAAEVRRSIATARRLADLPVLHESVRRGDMPAGHAAMISAVAAVHPDAESRLVEASGRGTAALRDACVAARAEVEDEAARDRRQRAARSLRIWNDEDGMLEGRFRLPPVEGGKLRALIDAKVRAAIRRHRTGDAFEPMEAYAADALCDLLFGERGAEGDGERERRGGAEGGPHRVSATMHLLIDFEALVRGRARPGERCEIPGVGPVSVAHARRLLGDAFLTAIVHKGRDIRTVAHLGRHVPAELRTALVVSGWECVVEGCGARGSLEIDHSEIDHADGGPTAWGNLAPLCPKHHRRKTAGARLGPPDRLTGKRPLLPGSRRGRRQQMPLRE